MPIHRFRILGLGAIVAISIGLAAACQPEASVRASPTTQAGTSSVPAATTSVTESTSPTSSAPAPSSAEKSARQSAQPASSKPTNATRPATTKPRNAPVTTKPRTTAKTAGSGPVTSANLPASNLIFGVGAAESETSTGWESGTSYCKIQQPRGAQHIQHRKFPSEGGESSAANVFVMDFPTAKQASDAVAAIATSYGRCADGKTATYRTEEVELTTATGGSEGPFAAVAHRIFPTDRFTGFTTEGLVIQVGARVMWVELVDFGISECNSSPGGESVQCDLYANANSLALRLAA